MPTINMQVNAWLRCGPANISDTTIGALSFSAYDMIFCIVVDHDLMAYIAYALQGISLALIFTAGQLPNKFFPFSECNLPEDNKNMAVAS